MSYPLLDKTIMPFIAMPFSSENEDTVQGLGGKAYTGPQSVTVEFITIDGFGSNTMQALYTFWKDTCNYGLSPFLISVPWMGEDADNNYPNFLVKFQPSIKSDFNDYWNVKQKLTIVGIVQFIDYVNNIFVVKDPLQYLTTSKTILYVEGDPVINYNTGASYDTSGNAILVNGASVNAL